MIRIRHPQGVTTFPLERGKTTIGDLAVRVTELLSASDLSGRASSSSAIWQLLESEQFRLRSRGHIKGRGRVGCGEGSRKPSCDRNLQCGSQDRQSVDSPLQSLRGFLKPAVQRRDAVLVDRCAQQRSSHSYYSSVKLSVALNSSRPPLRSPHWLQYEAAIRLNQSTSRPAHRKVCYLRNQYPCNQAIRSS